MLEKIKKIFKKKPKAKAKAKPKKVEEVLVLDEDKTFENEVKKPEVKETVSETKSETKSSLTFGE
jgi:hypothetical protein